MNEEFYTALRAWHLTKTWGLANGNVGWANEDADYIEAISAIDNEQNAMENEAMENATSKNKMKTTKTGRPGKVGKTIE
jgi:hypothetical protein